LDAPVQYAYKWLPGSLVTSQLLDKLAQLYSAHYGIWGEHSPNAFLRIRLSPTRIQVLLSHRDARLALALVGDTVVGYAIAVQPKVPGLGIISWVTQLVVHADHRQRDVGKHLLFSIWEFSDHFAWGLVTANPYAVRALEKATRRRCDSLRIARNHRRLINLGSTYMPYIKPGIDAVVNDTDSRVNTDFFIDHSELPFMVERVDKPEAPWTLGKIPEGWEWLAFTFQDQTEIGLSETEIENMLRTSDAVTKHAYMRMRLNASHGWAQFTQAEVDFIISECRLSEGTCVLDLGCGSGRHVMELARRGVSATGIDYLQEAISERREKVQEEALAQFQVGDARSLYLERSFDAVLCLYDVIGSYADDDENMRIIRSIRRHLGPSRRALLSVMNFDLTHRRAKHVFSLTKEPNRLLQLPASRTMETSGNVFNPDYYMIDERTEIVYRREQFTQGTDLPVQLLVRDRRYRRRDIEAMCLRAGLDVLWARYVRAGHWDVELSPEDENAKEILLLCEARD
jgi:SAM-dependent methyltransferase